MVLWYSLLSLLLSPPNFISIRQLPLFFPHLPLPFSGLFLPCYPIFLLSDCFSPSRLKFEGNSTGVASLVSCHFYFPTLAPQVFFDFFPVTPPPPLRSFVRTGDVKSLYSRCPVCSYCFPMVFSLVVRPQLYFIGSLRRLFSFSFPPRIPAALIRGVFYCTGFSN